MDQGTYRDVALSQLPIAIHGSGRLHHLELNPGILDFPSGVLGDSQSSISSPTDNHHRYGVIQELGDIAGLHPGLMMCPSLVPIPTPATPGP